MGQVTAEMLKPMDIFSDLELEDLKDIAALCQIEEFAPRSFVYREGDRAEKIYLILEGNVSIEFETGPNKRIPIYTEFKGKMFGYPALSKPHTFETYTRCLDHVKLISLKAEELFKIFKKDNRRGYLVMNKLAEIMARKLRETRHQLLLLVYG